MSYKLPADGDWTAVDAEIRRQMQRQRRLLTGLSRMSGVSETTIRYISRPAVRQRSTLVALAAALGYRYDYLVDVLYGKNGPEEPANDIRQMLVMLAYKIDTLCISLNRLGVTDGNTQDLPYSSYHERGL